MAPTVDDGDDSGGGGNDGGITEMQLLETAVVRRKQIATAVDQADLVSKAAGRVVNSIKHAENMDSFLVREGVPAEHNQYHTSEGGGDGCCAVL